MMGIGLSLSSTPVIGRRGFFGALDALSVQAAAAYSTRRLRGGYTGPALRVRRSSDNVEANIGFTAAGGLDTATLLAHCGAGNGFVATWYDQSGNGRNATQATAAAQPRIVNAGAIEAMGGRPAVRMLGQATATFLDTADFLNQDFAAVSAARAAALASGAFPGLYSRGTSGAQGVVFMAPDVATITARFGATDGDQSWTSFAANSNHVISAFHGVVRRRLRPNAEAAIENTVTQAADNVARRLRIGATAAGTAATTFPGWVGEVIVFQGGIVGATEDAIHNNARTYWGA